MTAPESWAELLELGTATLYEASGLACFLDPGLQPAWPGATVVGTALPVHTAPGDNLPLHLAVAQAQPGEVLVVDAGGVPHGYWGEVLTVAAQVRGVRGLVIDGGVRDTHRLQALDFAVFSRWIALAGTEKNDPGTVGTPIAFGEVPVARGDLVVGDGDGVVVLPAARVDDILAAARERTRKEAAYLDRLRAGELTLDIYGFRPRHEGT